MPRKLAQSSAVKHLQAAEAAFARGDREAAERHLDEAVRAGAATSQVVGLRAIGRGMRGNSVREIVKRRNPATAEEFDAAIERRLKSDKAKKAYREYAKASRKLDRLVKAVYAEGIGRTAAADPRLAQLSAAQAQVDATAKRLADKTRENPKRKFTSVQSLLFARSMFSTTQARDWARSHGYKATSIDVTAKNIRIRQFAPSRGVRTRFRTIKFKPGVLAVITVKKSVASARRNPSFTMERDEFKRRIGKKIAKRGRHTARGRNDQLSYKFYVVLRSGKIISGYEYKEDAMEFRREEGLRGAKVMSRSALVRSGRDPKINANWGME